MTSGAGEGAGAPAQPDPGGTSRRGGLPLVAVLGVVLGVVLVIAMGFRIVKGGVILARKKANEAIASSFVSSLHGALKHYVQDTNQYPGREYPDGENAFPALFEALCGKTESEGEKGGPSAPYIEIGEEDLRVWDEAGKDLRPATREDLGNPSTKKYVLDPWDKPYVYRARASLPRQAHGAVVYSTGPDGIDQTILGIQEGSDDIGSW